MKSKDAEELRELAESQLVEGNVAAALPLFQRAFRRGDAQSGHRVGQLLESMGQTEESKKWFRSLANNGDAFAMNWIATAFRDEGDRASAEYWFRKSAEKGYAPAMNSLGFLLSGIGKVDEGATWYDKSATLGDHFGEFLLGKYLESKSQDQLAEESYKKSAEGGNLLAMRSLAKMLERQQRIEEANEILLEAVKRGDVQSLRPLASHYVSIGDIENAQKHLRIAADAGDTEAMNELGLILNEFGQSHEASELFNQSMRLGNVRGLQLFVEDKRTAVEVETVLKSLTDEAENGIPIAMTALSMFYGNHGRNVKSRYWIERAANCGEPSAFGRFGLALASEEAPAAASHWFGKAVKLGQLEYLIPLGYAFQDQGDLNEARTQFEVAKMSGFSSAKNALAQLDKLEESLGAMTELEFESFNLPMVLNRIDIRKWREEGFVLTMSFARDGAPVEEYELDELTENVVDGHQLTKLPLFHRIDFLKADRGDPASQQQTLEEEFTYLLDVAKLSIQGAKAIQLTTLGTEAQSIRYDSYIVVFEGVRRWTLVLSSFENGTVSERELAVLSFIEGSGIGDIRVKEHENPFSSYWDGFIALELDPLSLVRHRTTELMASLHLSIA